jgi:CRISPR system Cascade subunit CasA
VTPIDLLAEPVLAVDGASPCSLAEVLAGLSRQDDLVFSNLRPHQQAPWHAFLVQLAYLALEKAGISEPPTDASTWRQLLLALSHGLACAWHLCVDDWQQPAFLQPPCDPGREVDFKAEAGSAQALDILVTSRNFDEKSEKVAGFLADRIDAWIYALVTLQGGAPFQGAGNYSSMRMNGGFSARPQFRLAFERGNGAEFLRDLHVLQTGSSLVNADGDGIGSGRALSLLWLERWDDVPLALEDVHALALEVTRRVRVRRERGRLVLRRAGSKGMRVAAKEQLGAVRDPWIPLMVGDPVKALTVQADGFSYRRLSTLLFDRSVCTLPLLAKPSVAERSAGRPGTLIAQVLVGGQGRTDGLLRREVRMPMAVLRAAVDGDAHLAQRARLFVDLASKAAGQVLRPALIQFVDGSDDVDWKHPDPARIAAPWLQRLDALIDARFFPCLFDSIAEELRDDLAQLAWEAELRDSVSSTFVAACEALPTRNSSRAFACARAERLLQGCWRKQFNSALHPGVTPADEEAAST